jgi:hypothetical protein
MTKDAKHRDIAPQIFIGVVVLVISLVATWFFNRLTAPKAPPPNVALTADGPTVTAAGGATLGFGKASYVLSFRVQNTGSAAATKCSIMAVGLDRTGPDAGDLTIPAGASVVFTFEVSQDVTLFQGVMERGTAWVKCTEGRSNSVPFLID